MKKTCPLCGHDTRETVQGTFTMEVPTNVPGGPIVVENATWEHCHQCDENVIGHELNQAIERVQYQRLGLLTPEQIRQIREKSGLTATEMSQLLNAGDKSFTRWENGKSIQNKSTDTLLRLIDQHPELFAEINAQRDPQRQTLVKSYFDGLSHFKGTNEFALAAHGEQLSSQVCQMLRDRLLYLLENSDSQ